MPAIKKSPNSRKNNTVKLLSKPIAALVVALVILYLALQQGSNHTSAAAMQNASYIYCVGTNANSTAGHLSYYATVSSNGIGSWNQTTSYPVWLHGAGCSIYNNTIYCVGTNTPGYEGTAYYASVSASGVGQWRSTTGYGLNLFAAGCSASPDGYLYCVGSGETYATANSTLYAKLSGSGIGAWNRTTSYPAGIYGAGCSISNDYIYCVGDSIQNHSSAAYFAHVSDKGIGNWTQTTPYPVPMYGAGCSISNNYIYCVGTYGTASKNQSYFAHISSDGIGNWTQTTPYPVPMYGAGCSIHSGYIYCVGTYGTASKNQAYYAPISSDGIGNWLPTTPYPIQLFSAYCQIPGSGGGFLGGGGPN